MSSSSQTTLCITAADTSLSSSVDKLSLVGSSPSPFQPSVSGPSGSEGPEQRITTFFILSDTHNKRLPEPSQRFDVALFAGDHTQKSSYEEFREFVKGTQRITADDKFVIAGNHEYSLDPSFDTDPAKSKIRIPFGGKVENKHKLLNVSDARSLCRRHGLEYLDSGHHVKRLKNGTMCEIYVDSYTPGRGRKSAPGFRYSRDVGRVFNIPETVHVVMTHGPPLGILDNHYPKESFRGCHQLLGGIGRARPLLHCFGHNHEGVGVTRVSWKGVEDERPVFDGNERVFSYNREDPLRNTRTRATRSDLVTADLLQDWKRNAADAKSKCYRVNQVNHPVRKFEHTLFVNAAYEAQHSAKEDESGGNTGKQIRGWEGGKDNCQVKSKEAGRPANQSWRTSSLQRQEQLVEVQVPEETNVGFVVELELPVSHQKDADDDYTPEPRFNSDQLDQRTRVVSAETEEVVRNGAADLRPTTIAESSGLRRRPPDPGIAPLASTSTGYMTPGARLALQSRASAPAAVGSTTRGGEEPASSTTIAESSGLRRRPPDPGIAPLASTSTRYMPPGARLALQPRASAPAAVESTTRGGEERSSSTTPPHGPALDATSPTPTASEQPPSSGDAPGGQTAPIEVASGTQSARYESPRHGQGEKMDNSSATKQWPKPKGKYGFQRDWAGNESWQ